MTQKLKFVLKRVENIVGKGENAGYQHFLLFPQCFQKFFLLEVSGVRLNPNTGTCLPIQMKSVTMKMLTGLTGILSSHFFPKQQF